MRLKNSSEKFEKNYKREKNDAKSLQSCIRMITVERGNESKANYDIDRFGNNGKHVK